MKQLFIFLFAAFLATGPAHSQGADFVRGFKPVFEDNFVMDPIGDLPAKWSTSGSGEVVNLDRVPGNWFKINQPTAVSPELIEALPENCTIEFDLFLKNTSGIAPHIMFGLTTLSDVSSGDVYRNHLWVKCEGYNEEGNIFFGKQTEDLGSKAFRLSGFVGRKLHVSLSINKTRFRVWLDKQKVVDLPKVLSNDYRNNFFIACSEVIPASEEGVYFSNVSIAEGEIDARSLLIKQQLDNGQSVTNHISFNPQTNEILPQSVPYLDTIGQLMAYDPNLSIQINGNQEIFTETAGDNNIGNVSQIPAITEENIKMNVDKMKDYLVNKFHLNVDRIVTGVNNQLKSTKGKILQSNAGKKAINILTEFMKL
jgi:hypothetical protein